MAAMRPAKRQDLRCEDRRSKPLVPAVELGAKGSSEGRPNGRRGSPLHGSAHARQRSPAKPDFSSSQPRVASPPQVRGDLSISVARQQSPGSQPRHLKRGDGHLASEGKRRNRAGRTPSDSCATSTTVSNAPSAVASTACSRAPSQPSSMPASRVPSPPMSTTPSYAPSPAVSVATSRAASPLRERDRGRVAQQVPGPAQRQWNAPKAAGGRAAEAIARARRGCSTNCPNSATKTLVANDASMDLPSPNLSSELESHAGDGGSTIGDGEDGEAQISARSFIFSTDGTCHEVLHTTQQGAEDEDEEELRQTRSWVHLEEPHNRLSEILGSEAAVVEAEAHVCCMELSLPKVRSDETCQSGICASVYDALEVELSALLEDNGPSVETVERSIRAELFSLVETVERSIRAESMGFSASPGQVSVCESDAVAIPCSARLITNSASEPVLANAPACGSRPAVPVKMAVVLKASASAQSLDVRGLPLEGLQSDGVQRLGRLQSHSPGRLKSHSPGRLRSHSPERLQSLSLKVPAAASLPTKSHLGNPTARSSPIKGLSASVNLPMRLPLASVPTMQTPASQIGMPLVGGIQGDATRCRTSLPLALSNVAVTQAPPARRLCHAAMGPARHQKCHLHRRPRSPIASGPGRMVFPDASLRPQSQAVSPSLLPKSPFSAMRSCDPRANSPPRMAKTYS